ncbi:hypothetical protein [Providencia phage PSTCR6]|nr:hypothetical protein [Providencia phage PSTCR6]
MTTKTRGGATVPSRKADYLEYRVGDDTYSGNSAPIGNYGTDQSVLGARYPTVQGAIEDLQGTFLEVNSIIINDDGVNPQGTSQVDLLTIDGSVVSDTQTAIISVFGLPFVFEKNDTTEEIAAKIVAQAQDYIIRNEYFSVVQLNALDSKKIDIQYLDFRKHLPFTHSEKGVTFTTEMQSPAKAGYGVWNKIGTQEVTFVDQTDKKLLHYFKRIA